MGGDLLLLSTILFHFDFNPRLHYGRRPKTCHLFTTLFKFQSTPPLWEATPFPTLITGFTSYFNPRLHYGRRPDSKSVRLKDILISIHASTMGGDLTVIDFPSRLLWFQSTPPLWEATSDISYAYFFRLISIHASTMGGDWRKSTLFPRKHYFNPRLHYGRRHAVFEGLSLFL